MLVYHQIAVAPSAGTDRSTVTRDVLAAQLDMVRASGIAVVPVSRAYAEVHGS